MCCVMKLMPVIRGAGADSLIMADGFSCRQQIEDLAGTPALHLAEVLWQAIENRKQLGKTGPEHLH